MSKTLHDAKNEIRKSGLTVPQWAEKHGFKVRAVRAVLSGHNKGHFGTAHKIAVALGTKDATE